MSIQTRCILRRDIEFASGNKLASGTIIYVEDTDEGPIGTVYTDRGSATSWALTDDAYAVLRSQHKIDEIVIVSQEAGEYADIQRDRERMREHLTWRTQILRRELEATEQTLRELLG